MLSTGSILVQILTCNIDLDPIDVKILTWEHARSILHSKIHKDTKNQVCAAKTVDFKGVKVQKSVTTHFTSVRFLTLNLDLDPVNVKIRTWDHARLILHSKIHKDTKNQVCARKTVDFSGIKAKKIVHPSGSHQVRELGHKKISLRNLLILCHLEFPV